MGEQKIIHEEYSVVCHVVGIATDDTQHLNIAATIFSPSPTHFCCTAPMRTLMNVAPDSFAMAWFAHKRVVER